MTQEALKKMYQLLLTEPHAPTVCAQLESIAREALAQPEPWSPVSIGVDVTKEGAHVVGIYALDKDTSQIFYAKYHYAKDPQASQRKWVGLTDDEIWGTISRIGTSDSDVNPYAKLADARAIEAKLKEKNT
jgi:hypothetical protein